MKKFKNSSLPGGEKVLFLNNGSERLFMLYLIIVVNNKVFSFFYVFKLNIIDWQRKIANRKRATSLR